MFDVVKRVIGMAPDEGTFILQCRQYHRYDRWKIQDTAGTGQVPETQNGVSPYLIVFMTREFKADRLGPAALWRIHGDQDRYDAQTFDISLYYRRFYL